MQTRREFAKMAVLAGVAPALLRAKNDSEVNGVMIGAQTYSYRDLPDKSIDAVVKAMNDDGLSYAELWQGQVEPRGLKPEDMKKWRTSPASLEDMKKIKAKFDASGINIYSFNYSFRDNWTDEEIAQGMKMAKALGTKYITASSHVSIAPRVAPIAKEHDVMVAFHNHDDTRHEDEFAKPEAFAKAMQAGPNIAINLDIGHFICGRLRSGGVSRKAPSAHRHIASEGSQERTTALTCLRPGRHKIKEVLQLLKTKKYAIPAMIEYEYKGASDPVTGSEEVRRVLHPGSG